MTTGRINQVTIDTHAGDWPIDPHPRQRRGATHTRADGRLESLTHDTDRTESLANPRTTEPRPRRRHRGGRGPPRGRRPELSTTEASTRTRTKESLRCGQRCNLSDGNKLAGLTPTLSPHPHRRGGGGATPAALRHCGNGTCGIH